MDALTHLDAEKTVLGCALSDVESVYRALPLLKADDFSLDSHRRIYHVIAELAEAGKPVDELTVSDALATNRLLEAIGGVAYLSSLTYNVDSGMARITNVEHYADLILDKSRRRQARAAGTRLTGATEDSSVSTDECLRLVQESLLQIEAACERKTARHVKEFMPEVLRELETQARNQGLVGMTTGLHSLDLATGRHTPRGAVDNWRTAGQGQNRSWRAGGFGERCCRHTHLRLFARDAGAGDRKAIPCCKVIAAGDSDSKSANHSP